jgi:hypothetical protein
LEYQRVSGVGGLGGLLSLFGIRWQMLALVC